MPRGRSLQYDDLDQYYWDSGQEMRRAQGAKDRCKTRKKSTINKGIDDYFDRSKLRRSQTDDYDDFDDWDDLDEESVN